jgi:putative FmdB family regulatory protein
MLYDYQCHDCKQIAEVFTKANDETPQYCPVCHAPMKRILSWGGMNVFREEAPWVETCKDVIAKDTTDPAARAFLADPTRTNLKRWMKANNLRHLEDGEQHANRVLRQQEEQRFEQGLTESAMRRLQERRRIEL